MRAELNKRRRKDSTVPLTVPCRGCNRAFYNVRAVRAHTSQCLNPNEINLEEVKYKVRDYPPASEQDWTNPALLGATSKPVLTNRVAPRVPSTASPTPRTAGSSRLRNKSAAAAAKAKAAAAAELTAAAEAAEAEEEAAAAEREQKPAAPAAAATHSRRTRTASALPSSSQAFHNDNKASSKAGLGLGLGLGFPLSEHVDQDSLVALFWPRYSNKTRRQHNKPMVIPAWAIMSQADLELSEAKRKVAGSKR